MLRRLLFPLFCLLLVARPSAQIAIAPVDDLANSSSLVLTGRVTEVRVQADAGSIYTYAIVAVGDVLKGQLGDSTVVVKQLGGTLPDLGLYIADQATFRAEEEVLLFLAARPRDGTLYTVGLSRGKWQVLPNLSTGGRSAVSGELRVDLDDGLRAVVGASRAQSDPFVAAPPELQATAADFTFIPASEGGPARWHEVDDGFRIFVNYQNVSNLTILDGAIGAWNSVNTSLELALGAPGQAGTTGCQSFVGDGSIRFFWNDPCGELPNGDGVTFGFGGGYFTPGLQKTINGVVFNRFLQGLAILNDVGPHLAHPACMQDAAAHVLGHAVGLGHSSDPGALMYATLRPGCASGSSLSLDDINGLGAIYPAIASGGSAPHAPTAITNSVVLDTVTLSWAPATSGGVAQSYILEAGTGPGRADITTMELNSANASTMVGAVPPGVYHVRVRARNVLGISGPSPDTVVTVGPCAAPDVPTSLSYSTADNLVTIRWAAPVAGVVQGYWLQAGYSHGASDALVTALGPTPVFAGTAPVGDYYVRIAARNSCAVSPFTPDLLVSVRRCTDEPQPPAALSFSRNGNVVTLAWNNPASGNQPSRFEIHAGSAAGESNLLVQNTNSNATSFTAVAPPGIYYVRVRGLNNCGSSLDSNEVVIQVP